MRKTLIEKLEERNSKINILTAKYIRKILKEGKNGN